jgi:predicted nuclease of predicted toxin-antitoxin system
MWLLDANVDVHLAAVFQERGINCDTVARRGWKTLSNGELVAAAHAEGFRCLLTRDQLFGESASRALKSFPEFAVVVITLPQQRWPEYRRRFLEALSASPIRPVPGRLVHWPTVEAGELE